jgi:hypothetical protein
MGQKVVIGPIDGGLRNDRTAFVINNDSFPTLFNAYQWRGRLKRKRGTSFLGRLKRYFDSLNPSYGGTTTVILNGSGTEDLLVAFQLQESGNIVPGSVTITAPGPILYTDPAMDGTLSPSGTINYATGTVTIPAEANNAVSATFNYYPDLPVMGLEEFISPTSQFPGTLGFDTVYSYNITINQPFSIYDVSFYKNPSSTTFPGYVRKDNSTPTTWNGADYQQMWTINYSGALWATNGLAVPFDPTKVGMQFKPITGSTIDSAGPPALVTLTIVAHGLVQGDFVFINEIEGMAGINWQTGYVVSADPQMANTVQVEFPNATISGAYSSGGIAQYLTNRSNPLKDNIKFYDGDPTDGNSTTPTLNGVKGWVNFMPPLSQSVFSISNLPADIYYLVGCKMIVPFKDRLIFLGPVVQSSTGSPHYLQDTVIFSLNGTPYYTASYTNDPDPTVDTPTSPTNDFHPILVPVDQTAVPYAYFEDDVGFGGFQRTGIDEPITTSSQNEDVLVLGFPTNQVKMVYTGDDIIPFNFFFINSELGSSSTFTTINMDEGVLTRGDRGFVMANQNEAKRFDLGIPDEVFQMALTNNGTERITAQRDFLNEWVYFTYSVNNNAPDIYRFPNQTLQYNYRDQTWAIFKECYTTYGQFRQQTGYTWATIGTRFPTWNDWNEPWNAGSSTLLQPQVIAGNQQGFVVFRDDGTGESPSLYIQDIVGIVITSPSHTLNEGDYFTIQGALGTVGPLVNGKIFTVAIVTPDQFTLNPGDQPIPSGTYLGGATITRMYVPFIQSRQFPVAWEIAKKTRLGPQQYLITTTNNSQITLLIFLSQDANNPYNDGPIVPAPLSINNSLIYSTVLYTCPESTNLGLTPTNINLQMVTANTQAQIWHRINTSLIGDTVQVGFTLSDAQMRNPTFRDQFSEIEIHGFILDVSASMVLA